MANPPAKMYQLRPGVFSIIRAEAFWSDEHFKAYYRMHGGSGANAYFIVLDVADYIIREARLRILKG